MLGSRLAATGVHALGLALVSAIRFACTGYLDPAVRGGFSSIASYLVLIAVLFARPHGLLGRPTVERV